MALALSDYGIDRHEAEKLILSMLPAFGKHKGLKSHADLTKSLDRVFETIAADARTRGSPDVKATSVKLTRRRRTIGYGAFGETGWPFPLSGEICFYFCPDRDPGGPPPTLGDDECTWICINWTFP